MTTSEAIKAGKIMLKLWAADLATTDYRGREDEIRKATGEMVKYLKDGDYQGYYQKALEINGIFKALRQQDEDTKHWEH